ncbi:hypothetical protein AAF712_005860 [Marasmius tenuissimus]|uniref:CCHC-type domain-containing protein n=1 Tax=Marasmius tenuissimus TaxID=585030 RepID=A0ABR3A0B9_9AGAR
MRITQRVASQLPRLTLFSGPSCSLCDTAKEELAKVRKNVQTISSGNSEYPGSGTGAVETQICLLDPSSSPRRQGNRERQMGRDSGQSGIGGMGSEERARRHGDDVEELVTQNQAHAHPDSSSESELSRIPTEYLFFTDISSGPNPYIDPYFNGTYIRNSEVVIGETIDPEDTESQPTLTSHCFNCGHPEHAVSKCPFRIDRGLVELSRQYYDFFRDIYNTRIGGDFHGRLYSVEEWKQTRLSWLEYFVPGKIQGPELRDALGMPMFCNAENEEQEAQASGQDEWLRNMALWGYPPGWESRSNPLAEMRRRIVDQCTDEDVEDQTLVLHQDDGVTETVSLLRDNSGTVLVDTDEETLSSDDSHNSRGGEVSSLRRWAEYPTSHFLYRLLPVYRQAALPPIGDEPPPPPAESPPPLPPAPPLPPPPPPDDPPPPLPPLPSIFATAVQTTEECDMDMSDDE